MAKENEKINLKVNMTMECTIFRNSSATESNGMAIKCLILQSLSQRIVINKKYTFFGADSPLWNPPAPIEPIS